MTLYRENPPGAFAPWRGERIAGVLYPMNIATLWPAEELATLKLYQPVEADPVPEGKLIASTSVKRVDGVVKYVHALEDVPVIIPQSISMRQARLALLQAGLLSSVEAAIDAIAEPERTAARIEWEYATEMKRDHTLIETLAVGLSLTPEQIDQLFQTAVAL